MKNTQNPERLINLTRYPIHDLASLETQAFVATCRQNYIQTGLCLLPEFIEPGVMEALVSEATEASKHAYFCKSTHNAYLTEDDPTLPANSINRKQENTFVGSVPYDRIAPTSLLNSIYQWDPLREFIASVLGKSLLHRFADPLGACSINVFVDGGEHGWHFDESEFTITLMLQPPTQGGNFEYVPLVRHHPDEKEILNEVLNGSQQDVASLPFSPGTLLIFGGNQTLHRVTKVHGPRPRLVPVLCYSEKPNQQNSESVRRLFWGRSQPDV